jgi:S1-C subfamily serine protease
MHKKFIFFLGLISFLFTGGNCLAQQNWTEQIAAFKPLVVNIETSSEINFETESQGKFYATGFIVDAKRGIIATNAHVTEKSPSYVRINFYDGSFTEAKVLYTDPVHDFGFYKIDPEKVEFKLQAVKCKPWKNLATGEELLLIGNNEKEEYSVKFGTVANININKGFRHASYVHTTFDSAGGSSGSPVWNTKGEVIGIHSRGTDTSSFELQINYLLDALEKIKSNTPIKRGDIGVDLQLITVGEAIYHFNLPQKASSEIKALCKGLPKVIQIERLIPRTTGKKLLKEGDIIYRLNDICIGDSLYLFDAILNENVDKTISLEIFRNGIPEKFDIYVEDLEKKKIKRFVRFAGAIFHDISPYLRWLYYLEDDGVYMSFASEGSSFSDLGSRDDDDRFFRVIISEINNQPVRNIDDFIKACSQLKDGQHIFVIKRDFMQFNTAKNPENLTVNLKYGALELYSLNENTLEWDKDES